MQRTKKIFLDLMLAGVIFLLVLMMFALSSCKHQPQILPADLTGGNENPGSRGPRLQGTGRRIGSGAASARQAAGCVAGENATGAASGDGGRLRSRHDGVAALTVRGQRKSRRA